MGITQELQNELFEPRYDRPETRAAVGSYVEEGMKKVHRHYKENGVRPPKFRGLTVVLDNLPTYVRKAVDGTYRAVGKVFGSYLPGKRELTVDPAVVYANHPVRKLLERSGMKVQSPEDVVTHELVHAAHDDKGMFRRLWDYFGNNMRDYAEGLATYVTEKITGKPQGVYPKEQKLARDFVSRRGYNAALAA